MVEEEGRLSPTSGCPSAGQEWVSNSDPEMDGSPQISLLSVVF